MTTATDLPEPHVAERIEPGAILYSSWGYDQTNIDFYYVVRTTAKSAWIVPMTSVSRNPDEPDQPWSMTEYVRPGVPILTRCQCGHSVHGGHDTTGRCYMHGCECVEVSEVPSKTGLYRIQRYSDRESLRLTSYSFARLWEGREEYASHYA